MTGCDVCWICLGEADECKPLLLVCKCPRPVHAACAARWQLQSAGKSEETQCRFCAAALPDWRQFLTPEALRSVDALATMSITLKAKTAVLSVSSEAGAYEEFLHRICCIFDLPSDAQFNFGFDCDDPLNCGKITLSGARFYHAAVHCAKISAARRLTESRNIGES
ncbi:g974 [Coccomyxa elongata]